MQVPTYCPLLWQLSERQRSLANYRILQRW
jgi:serine/threonine kinase 4